MSTKTATAGIMAIIEKMFEEDGCCGKETALAAKPTVTKKLKLEITKGSILTTAETLILFGAACLFHFKSNLPGEDENVEGAIAFANQIYHKAEDELKPKYKEEFNTAEIAEALLKAAHDSCA
jgi:hypothetical protein